MQVVECGLKNTSKYIKDAGFQVTGLCRGGMFSSLTDAGLKANIEDNMRAIDEGAVLGADCLVLVVGGKKILMMF